MSLGGDREVAERGLLPGRRKLVRRLLALRGFGWVARGAALAGAAAVGFYFGVLLYILLNGAGASIGRFGLGFLGSSAWSPSATNPLFGAAPAIAGTLLTSALALALGVPVALGVALFLSESAPRRVRRVLGQIVDFGATVPSVLFGFWAVIAIVPVMREQVEPFLYSVSGGVLFSAYPEGFDVLTASIVLAVMIVPTIAAVSRSALEAVPQLQRESALSLGATRWEAARMAVLGPARPGILGGILLGLGRAVGETIVVLMVMGGVYEIPSKLTSPGTTLAGWIAVQFSSLTPGTLEYSSMIELGLLLLLISVLVNLTARLLLRGISETSAGGQGGRWGSWTHRLRSRWNRSGPSSPTAVRPGAHPAVRASPLTAATRPRWLVRAFERAPARRIWRRRAHGLFVGASGACLVLACLPLAAIVYTALERGGGDVVRPTFYTSTLPVPCVPGHGSSCSLGGIGPELQGTLLLLLVGLAVAVPIGLLAGIWLSEYGRGRISRTLSFLAEILTGVPTILVGMLVAVVLLSYDQAHHTTYAIGIFSGGIALGLVMVPILTRTTEEALRSVPASVREAALAIGFPRHRVVGRVVLGSARGALLAGGLLALSRAVGDTAALIFTVGVSVYWYSGPTAPVSAIAPFIFYNFNSGYPNVQEAAWGAALVLLGLMVLIAIVARVIVHLTGSGHAPGTES